MNFQIPKRNVQNEIPRRTSINRKTRTLEKSADFNRTTQ
jgi:hypothetical protein